MTISIWAKYALGLTSAAALLGACSSGSSQLAPSATTQQQIVARLGLNYKARHPDRSRSWMAHGAKQNDLLYISDLGTSDVYVYSYPKGKVKGVLTGFNGPYGLCSNKAGDVYIANFHDSDILEYAHGGTKPIEILKDPGYYPTGCSFDPTTGNLAVTNWETTSNGSGIVAIYAHAKGSPKAYYTDPEIFAMLFCSYDSTGNLFVDGWTQGSAVVFAELPSGRTSFKNIALNQAIGDADGVGWDGKYVVVGDQDSNVIYQFTINGRKGQEVGSTPLVGSTTPGQFSIQGTRVIAPDTTSDTVGIWRYPAGGSAIKTITGFEDPEGTAVSEAK